MKLNRFNLATLIAPISMVTLAACGGGSSSGNNAGNNTVPDNNLTEVVLFDETTDGDIANDPNNPQPLQFMLGENSINATVVSQDLDYLTVNVPAGSELTAIKLVNYSANDLSFIAIQAGSVFTELPDDPAIGNLLGYTHFGVAMIGSDILPGLGLGAGAQGFTPPLEAGDYSFWIQEIGSTEINFSLNFVVESAN